MMQWDMHGGRAWGTCKWFAEFTRGASRVIRDIEGGEWVAAQ